LGKGQEALLFAKLPLPALTPPTTRKEVSGKVKKKTVRESAARHCEWLLVPNGTTLQCKPVFKCLGLKSKPESCPVQQEIPVNNWVGICRNANNCLKFKNITK